jgi:hypothetical protein
MELDDRLFLKAKWYGGKRASCRMACNKYRHKPLKHFSMVSRWGRGGRICHGVRYKQSGSQWKIVAGDKAPREGKNNDGERDGEIAGPVALRVSKLLGKPTVLFSQSFGGVRQLQTRYKEAERVGGFSHSNSKTRCPLCLHKGGCTAVLHTVLHWLCSSP